MLLFCIVAVFLAGLMVGRTPEYVGKKIGPPEIKMTIFALSCVPAAILGLTAVAGVVEPGLAGLGNAGPHGFSEILYAYTSATATNGSAFAGLNANSPFYNLTLALAMFVGRFLVIVPLLAVAGSLAAQPIVPRSQGTLPTERALDVCFLLVVIVIVGALSYLPASDRSLRACRLRAEYSIQPGPPAGVGSFGKRRPARAAAQTSMMMSA